MLSLSSCGPEKESAPGGGASADAKPAASGSKEKPSGPAAKKPAVVVPQPINLRKFAIMEGAELQGSSPANLSYKAKGDVKSVYEFQRKQFVALGWKELPDTSVTDQSVSGSFTGAGYTISASVYSVGTPGSVDVMLHNHGSVNLSKLPLPPGVKPLYVGPLTAMYVTEAPVAETAAATRKLLTDAGWEPHGGAGDSAYFKQGLNRITATVSSAPAQGGKTAITFLSEAMSGDLPAPPDAENIRYVDTQQKLMFDTASDKNAVIAFYKEKLAKTGWKPNHEETYRIDDHDEMVFRTGGGDVIFLKLMRESGGRREVSLGFLSADDIAELDKKYQQKADEEKRSREAAEKGAPAKP